MDLLSGSKPALPKLVNPTIRIHVPLDPEETVNINFTALAEAKYGWDALHPVAARLRAMNRYDSEEESDSDMQDVPGDIGSAQPAPQPLQPSQPKKRKRRKMNEYETYDIDDPFIDDDELNLQELTAVSKDGFFVFQGPLVGEGDKVRIEKADGTQRRGNVANGASTAAKRSAHARSKSKATSTLANGSAPTTTLPPNADTEAATSASVPASPIVPKKQANGKAQATPVAPVKATTPPKTTSTPSTLPVPASTTSKTPIEATTTKSVPASPSAPGSPANSTADAAALAEAAKKANKPPRTDEQRRQMRENAARRRAQKKEETRLEVLRRALRNPLLDTSELQAAMAVAGGEAAVALHDVIKLTNRALGLAEHSAAATTETKLRELDVERKAAPLDMENIVELSKRVAAVAMQSYLAGAQESAGATTTTDGTGTNAVASPPTSLPPTFGSVAEGAPVMVPTSAPKAPSGTSAPKVTSNTSAPKATSSTSAPKAASTSAPKAKAAVRSPDKTFVKPATPAKAKKEKQKEAASVGSPSGRSMSLTALID